MIIRHKQKGRFVQLPNAIFEDPLLSLDAKGMLGYLLSRPRNWVVRHGHLRKTLRIGRKRLDRIMEEISAAGYGDRDESQGRDEHNRFTTYNYVVSDVPNERTDRANMSDVRGAHRPPPQPARNISNK